MATRTPPRFSPPSPDQDTGQAPASSSPAAPDRPPAAQASPRRATRSPAAPSSSSSRSASQDRPGVDQDAAAGETGGDFLALAPDALRPPPELSQALAGLAGAPGAAHPELPPSLASRLTTRELRTVWFMVAGQSYQQALTSAGVSKAARLRRDPCPPHVRDAAEFLVRRTAELCGASREWIVAQLVHVYRAASRAVPVLDRGGRPTGDYRADWPAAVRALELLGNQAGMFGRRIVHDVPSDVRELMHAVAQRGRAELEPARSPQALPARPGGRVLDPT